MALELLRYIVYTCLCVTLVLFIGSHNMQLSIMLNSLLVGLYPPIEIRIEANLLEDFVTVMFSQAFNCKYSECILEYSLVLACEMDCYDPICILISGYTIT